MLCRIEPGKRLLHDVAARINHIESRERRRDALN